MPPLKTGEHFNKESLEQASLEDKFCRQKRCRRIKQEFDPDYKPALPKCYTLLPAAACNDEKFVLFRRSTRLSCKLESPDAQTFDTVIDCTLKNDNSSDDRLSEISDFVDLDDEMFDDLDLFQDIDCTTNRKPTNSNMPKVINAEVNRTQQHQQGRQLVLARAISKFESNSDDSVEVTKPVAANVLSDTEAFLEEAPADEKKVARRKWPSYVCPICQRSFQQLGHLRSHFFLHTGERPFVCEICNKSFSQSGHLISHINSHTSNRPYVCDYCGKRFTQSGHKRNHERSHLGIRPYECNQCGKKFTQSGHLVNHLRIHDGDKPYECEVCGKAFTQSGHLGSHMKTHYNFVNATKSYDCKICQKQFTRMEFLKDHLKIHRDLRPFRCNLCEAKFSTEQFLTMHAYLHTKKE